MTFTRDRFVMGVGYSALLFAPFRDPDAIRRLVLLWPHPAFGEAGGVRDGDGGGSVISLLVPALAVTSAPGSVCT